jgi:toxin CcdB
VRQFDLYENPVASMRRAVPYVVVLSSHLLGDSIEIIVGPVQTRRSVELPDLEIPVSVDDDELLINVLGMAAIRRSDLRRRKGSLIEHEDDIRRALERLFTGF